MSTILDKIIASKRRELGEAQERTQRAHLERRLADAPPVRDFRAALEAGARLLCAHACTASPVSLLCF